MALKSRGRIRQGLKTFQRRSGRNLTVFYNVQPVQGASLEFAAPLKWVFMVPKRIGTAVTRNRLRRQIREIARVWAGRQNLCGEIMVRLEPKGSKTAGRREIPTQAALKEELIEILASIFRKTCET